MQWFLYHLSEVPIWENNVKSIFIKKYFRIYYCYGKILWQSKYPEDTLMAWRCSLMIQRRPEMALRFAPRELIKPWVALKFALNLLIKLWKTPKTCTDGSKETLSFHDIGTEHWENPVRPLIKILIIGVIVIK